MTTDPHNRYLMESTVAPEVPTLALDDGVRCYAELRNLRRVEGGDE